MPERSRSYRLVYFDIKWRAEPLRLLFHYFAVPFEDRRISGDDWAKRKSDAPFEQLPLLEIDDGKVVLSESLGIGRYLCKSFEHGFIGKTKTDAARADMIVYSCNDLFIPIYFMNNASDEDKEAKTAQCKGAMLRFLKGCERVLKKNGGGQFVGDEMTWADIYAFYMLWMIDDLQTVPIDKSEYPSVHAFYLAMRENDRIKEYIAAHFPSHMA